jgi:integrase
MASYWFTARPENVEHQHPFLVFDSQDHMHLPLTQFAKEARSRLDPKTVPTYLYALCPYFTWLDTNVWQVRLGQTWDAPPTQVRRSIDDYLTQKLQCQILPQRQGWKYVKITTGTKSTLRIFLAALKLFYQVMREHEMYSLANPLVDFTNATITAAMDHLEKAEDEHTAPPMPAQSGVETSQSKPHHRLTDAYYKLEHDEWQPQIIDDPNLPGYILKGGQCLSLKQTRLRDEVVTWLLFETGARVSEVVGLLLSDWAALGTKNRAKTFSKGSSGRRIKTISFAEETVILLRRYFDEERIAFDSQGYSLDLYLELAARRQIDLSTVPLFLSRQGTHLTPKAYRDHYWNPACQVAGIAADVHQARHWHVTRSVRDIYETAKNTKEIEQRLRDLVEYMKWKSEEMLAAYQHYFDEQRHADTQGQFHKRMHAEVQRYLAERQHRRIRQQTPSAPKDQIPSTSSVCRFDDEPDLSFLYSLAGGR